MSNHLAEIEQLPIGKVLRRTAGLLPDQKAVVFCQYDVSLTWSEFDTVVDEAARSLLALGFKRGDHLGVWATNCLEWVTLQYATARIGVVMVTINPGYKAHELDYVVKQSELRGLFLIDSFKTSDYVETVEKICPSIKTAAPGELSDLNFPNLKQVVLIRGEKHSGMHTWDSFIEQGKSISDGVFAQAEALPEPSDPINIQYTSGTTGNPKGAMLTHHNLIVNAYHSGHCQVLDHTDLICIPVPLYHCFGCVLGSLCSAVLGCAMVFPHESFDAEATLKAIDSENCTSIYGVPTMFIGQLEHANFADTDTSSLRTGIMAGSPCPVELMKRVTHDMGAEQITIGYGLTEASPIITMTLANDPIELRVGTVGQPITDIEVKVVDKETGADLPDNQSGELCCRGHNVMLGYFNMPDRTAEAIDAEGWLHTGDLALREPNGYYRITGRLKDMIVRGGENIAPREVEELLYHHPQVEDVQIVGVPDARLGEEILACIKLREANSATEDEIRDFCREKLAHFKVPKYVQFVEQFPTTVTGKIQKYRIRKEAIKLFNLQDAADIETA